ncbi:hypothetical protein WA026_023540 [Henosepilachna vigintioctopunctata]|uniref:Uncharacterized protein n=1 Tax=Henosepilachna vigintioctopunctata TaxID=420089 RepID=A0AAW1USR5_9CUCU
MKRLKLRQKDQGKDGDTYYHSVMGNIPEKKILNWREWTKAGVLRTDKLVSYSRVSTVPIQISGSTGASSRALFIRTIVGFLELGQLSAMVILEYKWAEAAPRLMRREDMVKELMKLDQYYSSIARPSVRSAAPEASMSPKIQRAINMLRLQNLDRLYADRSRPRYGKRAETVGSNFSPLDLDGQYQSDDNIDYSAVRR